MHRTGPLVTLLQYGLTFAFLLLASSVWGQQPAPAAPEQNDVLTSTVRDLQEQVRQLREAVAEIRTEAAQYRAETLSLRLELQQTRAELGIGRTASAPDQVAKNALPPTQSGSTQVSPAQATLPPLEERVARLEEDTQLLGGKVNEQYQTKVESASKYRVRLSGIVLMNLFSNRGTFDNQDFPSLVRPFDTGNPHGSFGATLRQSEIGLEAFGPHVAGASTRADIHFDFAGGFPNLPNGVNSGIVRLRTATFHLDWKNTSVIGGQDEAFFSPLNPTSFASLAIPEFNYAGNLWEWVPQVRVEHRFNLSDSSNFLIQGGILDNLTGDLPANQWGNIPQPGERSGQPAYATRVAWTRRLFGQPLTLGAGGYYSRQDWWFGRHLDGWAGTTDWDLPLSHGFSLSGEFYRGFAIGALGGGVGRSVIMSDAVFHPYSLIRGLDSIGGWSQLKFKPTERLEFNAAFGVDNPYSDDVRAFPIAQFPFAQTNSGLDPTLKQNRNSFINVIYRPHQNLLFSAQYNYLRTSQLDLNGQLAKQVNLIMGVLF